MTITLGKLIERLKELQSKSTLGNDTPVYLCYDEVGEMPITVNIEKLPLGIDYRAYPRVIVFVNGPELQAYEKQVRINKKRIRDNA